MLILMALALRQEEPESRMSERNSQIATKLKTMTVDVNFADAPFDEVIKYMSEYTGVNMYVAPAAYEKAGRDSMKVTLKVKGVRVQTALKLTLQQFDLGAIVKDGLVEITSKEKINFNVVTRVYDVRDLFVKINNFAGPRLELISPTGAGGAGGGGAAAGVTFSLEEPSEPKINVDFLTDLIREMCEPKSWEENSHASIQMAPNGLMIMTQTKSVHRQVEQLVNMLREVM